MALSRREYLLLTAGMGVSVCWPAFAEEGADLSPQSADLPATGENVAELAAFDDWMRAFLTMHGIPGGQLAIARGGRVLYARGFGYAEREAHAPVEPDSLFRIASVSKPITAAAVLLLMQRGKLKLTDKVDEILSIEPHLEPRAKPDERWRAITLEHCLSHTGGWDRDASFDPMFAYERVAKSLGVKLPIGTAEIIRYMRGQALDFAPGERYAYSNFGYCLLGRVIEKLSGQPYETFVRDEVFAPLGVTAPRIGRSLREQRAEHEVCYYTYNDVQAMPVVGLHAGESGERVPLSYGGWNQEALDAHGGWIASATDLAKFASALDDAAFASKPLLTAESVQTMFAPHATINADTRIHYGLGWVLGRDGSDERPLRAHGGALPCTAAALVKTHDGLNLAVLFNLGQDQEGFLGRGLDGALVRAVHQVKRWPDRK
jgi:N-acyl-D-amino-acid deacylase